jgi:hypothetical protein
MDRAWTLVTQQRTSKLVKPEGHEVLSDEAQRTASLGERGCENLDNSTTAYCIVRIFPLSNLWLRHALLARQGSWSTREDDDEK